MLESVAPLSSLLDLRCHSPTTNTEGELHYPSSDWVIIITHLPNLGVPILISRLGWHFTY